MYSQLYGGVARCIDRKYNGPKSLHHHDGCPDAAAAASSNDAMWCTGPSWVLAPVCQVVGPDWICVTSWQAIFPAFISLFDMTSILEIVYWTRETSWPVIGWLDSEVTCWPRLHRSLVKRTWLAYGTECCDMTIWKPLASGCVQPRGRLIWIIVWRMGTVNNERQCGGLIISDKEDHHLVVGSSSFITTC